MRISCPGGETPEFTDRIYGRLVESALRFPTWDKAAPHADAAKFPALVAAAFDMDTRMMVVGG